MIKQTIASVCLAAFVFSATFFFSCTKSDNSKPSDTTTEVALNASASADNQADAVYNDVTNNVIGVNSEIGLGAGVGVFVAGSNNVEPWAEGWEHCFTVTISPETVGVFPKTVTIDFGEGCTGRDGHVRKGKIITVYTGPMFVAGNIATTTFDGFYFDSLRVEGQHVLTNNSTADGHVFSSEIQDGKLTAPSGNYIVWERTRIWTQTDGSSTAYFPLDDVYNITGSSNGTIYYAGTNYQWTGSITQPLVHKLNCPWVISGEITITGANATSVLDFGDGTCDRKATLTINGKIFEIIW